MSCQALHFEPVAAPADGGVTLLAAAGAPDINSHSDALLLISLFVLGGEFWDKLRALFIHQAKVRFPEETAN